MLYYAIVVIGSFRGKMAAKMVRAGMHLLSQIRLQNRRLELRNYYVGSHFVRRKTLQGIT